MPELIKLYIRNVAIGFALAGVFVAMLLWFDVQGLWHLVSHSSSGPLAVFLLWFMHGIVFAGVQFAWAVMALAERPEGPSRGKPAILDVQPVAVPVKAPARNRAHRQKR